jgi:hypothetical protein
MPRKLSYTVKRTTRTVTKRKKGGSSRAYRKRGGQSGRKGSSSIFIKGKGGSRSKRGSRSKKGGSSIIIKSKWGGESRNGRKGGNMASMFAKANSYVSPELKADLKNQGMNVLKTQVGRLNNYLNNKINSQMTPPPQVSISTQTVSRPTSAAGVAAAPMKVTLSTTVPASKIPNFKTPQYAQNYKSPYAAKGGNKAIRRRTQGTSSGVKRKKFLL